jgi:modulator of FtsH protease
VSVAYDPEQWHDLFVAMAGASAALAGLLFVAVSINVDRILRYEGLPERGLETLGMLLTALVVCVAGLMPGQSHVALGLEFLGIAAVLLFLMARLPVAHDLPDGVETPPRYAFNRQVIRLTGTALLVVGALGVLFTAVGGLYWVAAAMVFLTLGAVANAWVLLVEILR